MVIKRKVVRGFKGEAVGFDVQVGGVTLKQEKPVFVSGGGGRIPTPPPKTFSPQIEATREQARLAQQIRDRAREAGVSAEIQLTRDKKILAQKIRNLARQREQKLITDAQQLGFIQKLKREQAQAEADTKARLEANRKATEDRIRKGAEEKVVLTGAELRQKIFDEQKKNREIFLTKIENSELSQTLNDFTEESLLTTIGAVGGLLSIIKDPRKIKDVPAGLKDRFIEIKNLFGTNKARFLGAVVTELILLRGFKVRGKKINIKTKDILKSKAKFVFEKPTKVTKTPFAKTFPLDISLKIDNFKVSKFVDKYLKSKGIDPNLISKIERSFIEAQVKTRIRNNPKLFLSKIERAGLKRFRKKIKREKGRKLGLKSIEGGFTSPIIFTKIGKNISNKLTKTDKLILNKIIETKRAKKGKKGSITFTKKSFLNNLMNKIKTDPKLLLSKTQRSALRNIKITLSKINKVVAKKKPKTRKTPFAKTFPIDISLKINDVIIRKFVDKGLKNRGINPKSLSNAERLFIEGQLKTRIRNNPELFLSATERLGLQRFRKTKKANKLKDLGLKRFEGKLDVFDKKTKGIFISKIKKPSKPSTPSRSSSTGQQLVQIQKQKTIQLKPDLKIVPTKLTSLQKSSLKRFNKELAKQTPKKGIKTIEIVPTKLTSLEKLSLKRFNKELAKQKQIIKEQTILKQKQVQLSKPKPKTKLKQKQRFRQQQKIKTRLRQKTIQLDRSKLRIKSIFRQVQQQRFRQASAQSPRLAQAQAPRLRPLQKTKQRLEQKIRLAQRISQAQKTKQKKRLLLRLKTKLRATKVLIKKRKKSIRKKKKGKKKQSFNVLVRPLKRSKKSKKPKMIKINKRPLTKQSAKRLGSTIADNTLSRTFKIKPIKGKPKKSVFKTKPFKKKKFRTFKKVNKKKVPLKNTFIEKSRALIDTSGEKKGLSVRRGLKQLKIRLPVRKKLTFARKQELLRNLKKARAVRRKNLLKKPSPRIIIIPSRKVRKIIIPLKRKPIKRKVSLKQLKALARGRKLLAQRRKTK